MHLSSSPMPSTYDWVEVHRAVVKFGATLDNGDITTKKCKLATQEVRSTFINHGLSEVAEITVYNGTWDGVFILAEGTFVEMNTVNLSFPKTVVALGRLRKTTTHLLTVETDKKLYDMAHEHEWKELNISTEGRNVLNQIERLVRLWRNTRVARRHALLERTEISRGRVVAEISIGGRTTSSSGRLQQMAAQRLSAETGKKLYDMSMTREPELKELDSSTEGHVVLEQMEHLIRLLGSVGTSHDYTLLERTEDSLRHVIAQFLAARNSSSAGDGFLGAYESPFSLGLAHASTADIDFMQWDCDHLMSPHSNYFATVLAVATRQHPSVLTIITLNVSSLSPYPGNRNSHPGTLPLERLVCPSTRLLESIVGPTY